VLNEQLFMDPGLSPSGITTLVSVLKKMRKDAGDF
jgi:hypothetical protein